MGTAISEKQRRILRAQGLALPVALLVMFKLRQVVGGAEDDDGNDDDGTDNNDEEVANWINDGSVECRCLPDADIRIS